MSVIFWTKMESLFCDLGYSEINETTQNAREWLAEDANDPGFQLLSDQEIVTEATKKTNLDSDSDGESGFENAVNVSNTGF